MKLISKILKKLKLFEYVKNIRDKTLYFYRYSFKRSFTSLKVHFLSFFDYHFNRNYKLSSFESEIIKDSIIKANDLGLDNFNFSDNYPKISIIIINRNGKNHLERLFSNFKENTNYPNYEIIVWDNNSTDDSIDYLKTIQTDFNIIIHENKSNESFSKSNNESVKLSNGDYLLFLNNDILTTNDWLNQLVKTIISSDNIASVGSRLIYPDCSSSRTNYKKSFKIQHEGIGFKHFNHFLKPYNINNGKIINFSDFKNKKRPALTAAALLVSKSKFLEVEGFDEGYNYGYEDVDLCLKFLKNNYDNVYCPKSNLFHYEFGTQEKTSHKSTKIRRLNNINLFEKKWKKFLYSSYLMDKLNSKHFFTNKSLKICFAVSESHKSTDKGDFFTALELSRAITSFGWETIFLDKKNWYDVPGDVDILITMIDSYNLNDLNCDNKSIIKIAWPRNWFERWVKNPSFRNYDIVLTTSPTASKYIESETGLKSHIFPIATNPNYFNESNKPRPEFNCDYCFTGNYWHDKREIIDFLDPETIPYELNVYGRNWESINKFKKYHVGFVDYSMMGEVYASTKILIDDANRVTKNWGSVNSRVYDGLASGVLVLTNGSLGAIETFNGKLPVYKSKEELTNKINFYLENNNERQKIIKELRGFVLENHTYQKRAEELKNILENYVKKTKLAINVPAPIWSEVNDWGDYHIAKGLAKSFNKLEYDVKVQILPQWDFEYDDRDVILTLRGLSQYNPKKHHFNIMWNISHPDEVSLKEYELYNHVFIASNHWAENISYKVNVSVDTLLQCSDPDLFYYDFSEKYKCDLLFVGNSRDVYRKIIKDLLPTKYDLAVYGKGWENFISSKYIKANHIPNEELRKAYSSCKILLNDHWDDMRDKGFISNRIFDGISCNALIVTDKVKDSDELFENCLITYNDSKELKTYINNILINYEEIKNIKTNEIKSLKFNHSFQDRVKVFDEIIKNSFNH